MVALVTTANKKSSNFEPPTNTMSHTLLYRGSMLANVSDPMSHQPTYNPSFGSPPAGYNNYGPPPPVPNYSYGYYGNNHPSAQSAPPPRASYQSHEYTNYYAPQPQPQPQPQSHEYTNYYAPQPQSQPQPQPQPQSYEYTNYYAPQPQPQPQPPSNYGYSNQEYSTLQPARRPKAKNGKNGKSSSSGTSYKVSGNRVSGNKGDHNGIFNVGNTHGRGGTDNEEEED